MSRSKMAELDECTDAIAREKLTVIVDHLKSALAERPEDTNEPAEGRWLAKLRAMPRFRLEKLLQRKAHMLEECAPDNTRRVERLSSAVSAITTELASRGEVAEDPADSKTDRRKRRGCSKKRGSKKTGSRKCQSKRDVTKGDSKKCGSKKQNGSKKHGSKKHGSKRGSKSGSKAERRCGRGRRAQAASVDA